MDDKLDPKATMKSQDNFLDMGKTMQQLETITKVREIFNTLKGTFFSYKKSTTVDKTYDIFLEDKIFTNIETDSEMFVKYIVGSLETGFKHGVAHVVNAIIDTLTTKKE
jgi:hypothetical protein